MGRERFSCGGYAIVMLLKVASGLEINTAAGDVLPRRLKLHSQGVKEHPYQFSSGWTRRNVTTNHSRRKAPEIRLILTELRSGLNSCFAGLDQDIPYVCPK